MVGLYFDKLEEIVNIQNQVKSGLMKRGKIMDQYIKMVLALPAEFFTGWKWKAGDTAILMDDPYKRHVVIINSTYEITINTIAKRGRAELLFAGSIEKEFLTEWFDRLRPLPNIEQLQEMLNLNPIEFIEGFYEYSQEPLLPGMDNEQFKTDLECFTLAYVMDRKFKMYWDGEKWISMNPVQSV